MRYGVAVLLGAIFATASCAPAVATRVEIEQPAAGQYVPGEVIVQFQPGTSAQRIDEIVRLVGAQKQESLGMPLGYRLRFSSDIPVEEMMQRLRAQKEVRLAEPNWVIRRQRETQ